jgi:hypothetical protein
MKHKSVGNLDGFYDPEFLRQFHLERSISSAVGKLVHDLKEGHTFTEAQLVAAADYFQNEIYSSRGITPELLESVQKLAGKKGLNAQEALTILEFISKRDSMTGCVMETVVPTVVLEGNNPVRSIFSLHSSLYDPAAIDSVSYRRIARILLRGSSKSIGLDDICDSFNSFGVNPNNVFELNGSKILIKPEIFQDHYAVVGITIDQIKNAEYCSFNSQSLIYFADGKLIKKALDVKTQSRYEPRDLRTSKHFDENKFYIFLTQGPNVSRLNWLAEEPTTLGTSFPKNHDFFCGKDEFVIRYNPIGLTFYLNPEFGKDGFVSVQKPTYALKQKAA